jgi:hypothetical protein
MKKDEYKTKKAKVNNFLDDREGIDGNKFAGCN